MRVRSKLTNFLSDASAPQPDWNELPALYTQGGAHRLVTYTGRAPTRGGLREYTSADGGQFFVRPGPGSLPPSTGRRSSTTPASESGSSTAT